MILTDLVSHMEEDIIDGCEQLNTSVNKETMEKCKQFMNRLISKEIEQDFDSGFDDIHDHEFAVSDDTKYYIITISLYTSIVQVYKGCDKDMREIMSLADKVIIELGVTEDEEDGPCSIINVRFLFNV